MEIMKNLYMVFAGDHFYPGGGMNDFQSAYYADNDDAALAEALRRMGTMPTDWLQIVRMDHENATFTFVFERGF